MSTLAILFMVMDGVMKLLKPPFVLQTTIQLGYPETPIAGIGVALLVSRLLHAMPRTAIFGAILLTAYLGGAVASGVRISAPLFNILSTRLCSRRMGFAGNEESTARKNAIPLIKDKQTMMKLNTYLNFAGNCAEAFRYYEQHLGGKTGMMMTHGQAPDQSGMKPEWKDMVLHATIAIGGTELSAADIPDAEPMRSAYLTLNLDSDAEAERIFAALSAGGQIFMPLQETFFATRFGQLRDRFGMNWMVLHQRPM
ncbi:MAG TPA: DoxX family protein [Bryobacteraceae bacterium]|nr:DoxX family protein [Bryobacteraceae bacterium]